MSFSKNHYLSLRFHWKSVDWTVSCILFHSLFRGLNKSHIKFFAEVLRDAHLAENQRFTETMRYSQKLSNLASQSKFLYHERKHVINNLIKFWENGINVVNKPFSTVNNQDTTLETTSNLSSIPSNNDTEIL
jgi:hypothetical protein